MADTESPDGEQLTTILIAVRNEYPELEFFPRTVVMATVRAWFHAKQYDVTPQDFAEAMLSPKALQAVAFVCHRMLQNALK